MSAGILEAHTAGTVTAASMLVHGPGWSDGVARARATPTLDLGLHLNLLVGTPLTAGHSLRDRSGRFPPLATLVRRAALGRIDGDEVFEEGEAQLAALTGAGLRVSHIDSHRHTHALPVIRRAVGRLAEAHGLVVRRPVEARDGLRRGPAGGVRAALVAASWRVSSAGARPARTTEHFIGLTFHGDRSFHRRLERAIDRLPVGTTELMVHPGHVDDALAAVDAYTWPREREWAALTSLELVDRLRRRCVMLTDFRDV